MNPTNDNDTRHVLRIQDLAHITGDFINHLLTGRAVPRVGTRETWEALGKGPPVDFVRQNF